MSKGSHRRPSSLPKQEEDAKYEAIFGAKPLNIMSNEDRASVGLPSDDALPPGETDEQARAETIEQP